MTATYYASPSGNGDGLTIGTPASITSAASLAASGDTVYLRGGTYRLTSTLVFGAANSGVIWAACPGETPVISGSVQITGWSLHDSGKNIWKSTVPPGTVTRQLYVNGVRATRSNMTVGTRVSTNDNGLTYTSTDATVPTFARPADLEFSNPAMPWVMNRVSVASVSRVGDTTTWTMDGAVASWNAQLPAWATWATYPFAIENAYEFLSASTPGCWYLDSLANSLYYVPKAGEDMSVANVEMPTLTMLVSSVQGDAFANAQFNGVVFEGAGWVLPTTQKSYMQIQANHYLVKGNWPGNVNGYIFTNVGGGDTPPSGSFVTPPAAISLFGANNITFRQCTFRHLGGSGIEFGTGTKNCTLDRNTMTDVSANGIKIGDIATWSPITADQVSNNTVTNNTITNVAIEYQGGVGVFTGYTDHTKINHNEIANLPYSGISTGWGWNPTGYTSSYVNSVEIGWNIIRGVMNLLYDGGGVYSLGVQGSGSGLSVHDNYFYDFAVKVANTRRPGGDGAPLYADQGSNYVTYTNNLISKNPSSVCPYWSLFNVSANTGSQSISASGNYATSGLTSFVSVSIPNNSGTISSPNAITGTTPSGWPAGAQSIAAAAGPTTNQGSGSLIGVLATTTVAGIIGIGVASGTGALIGVSAATAVSDIEGIGIMVSSVNQIRAPDGSSRIWRDIHGNPITFNSIGG